MKNFQFPISNFRFLLALALFFSFGFLGGVRWKEKKIFQRASFDKYGFIKSVSKKITGRVLEVKKRSLVLTKNEKKLEVEIDPKAKITITILAPSGASPSAIASPGAEFLPPPEVIRQASLSDIRVGDKVTVSVTETPDGKLLGRVVSVERK